MVDRKPLALIGTDVKTFVAGDTLDPAHLPSAAVTLTGAQTLTNKTLTGAKFDTLYDSNGNEVVQAVATGSAVNFAQIQNQASGAPPRILSAGDDPNIAGPVLTSKGTGGPARLLSLAISPSAVDIMHVGVSGHTQTVVGKKVFPSGATDGVAIPDFQNSIHSHADAQGGGLLNASAIGAGTLSRLRSGPITAWDYTPASPSFKFAGIEAAGGSLGTAGPTANILYAIPFFAPARASTINQLGIEITTAVGASNVRLGVYTNTSDTNPVPDALVAGSDSGALSSATIGHKTAAVTLNLTAGALYWAVFEVDSASLAVRSPTTIRAPAVLGGAVTGGVFVENLMFSASHTFGALPGTFPAGGSYLSNSSAVFALISMRFSA